MNYLASPPLVVAYALAGTMDIDLEHRPDRPRRDGDAGVPARPLAVRRGDHRVSSSRCSTASMFVERYGSILDGDERWRALPAPTGDRYEWDTESTYIRRPPFLDTATGADRPISRHRGRARARAARRQRHHRPHLAGRQHPRVHARRGSG